MNQKKCKGCAHYNVCEFHLDEETNMTVEDCGDFMENNCDKCKYKECLAKLADVHIDCKDCPVEKCIMGVADNNVGEKSDVKIEDMDLSVRTYNCLKRAGLFTLSQLSELSCEDLTNIRNLGKRNVDEIIDKLKYYGYKIARSDEE